MFQLSVWKSFPERILEIEFFAQIRYC